MWKPRRVRTCWPDPAGVVMQSIRRLCPTEGERHVVPTETEGIVDRVLDLLTASFAVHHIQIDRRILVFQVQRRRDDAVPNAEHREYGLERADGTDRVAECGFRSVDRSVLAD